MTLVEGTFRDESPFWEALGQGELRLPRCAACGRWNWPVVARCPECGSFEHRWEQVEPTGTVYSWTRIRKSFTPERAAQVPYVVVLAEIAPAGAARVMGVLAGSDEGIRIGAAVRGTFHPPAPESKGLPSLTWTLEGGGRG